MEYIERNLSNLLRRLTKGFPVVGLTGPRQSGKTTLAKHCFPNKPYRSLEDPDQLDFALADPRGFLGQFRNGAVLDEVQRCPELFSYLQGIVDTSSVAGQWVLIGSQQFGFRQQASQTLAGRIGLATLLPFSMTELENRVADLNTLLFTGGYPPLYDRNILPSDWYASYVQTYLERDVQQLIRVKDLVSFRNFLRLCAGRAGQLINLSDLGNDAGVSHNTIKEWLSVLEASFIIYRLPPHYKNFSKRLIKTPKMHFIDTGLLCWLLGIRDHDQLVGHAMRGYIFESFVFSEFLKFQLAAGDTPSLFFWRDSAQLEVDLLVDSGTHLIPIETKSGATLSSDQFRAIEKWVALSGSSNGYLIYGGDQKQIRGNIQALGWHDMLAVWQTTPKKLGG